MLLHYLMTKEKKGKGYIVHHQGYIWEQSAAPF